MPTSERAVPENGGKRAGARIHQVLRFAFCRLLKVVQSGVQSHQRAHHVKGLGKIEMRPQITFLLAGSALCWTRPEKAIRIPPAAAEHVFSRAFIHDRLS